MGPIPLTRAAIEAHAEGGVTFTRRRMLWVARNYIRRHEAPSLTKFREEVAYKSNLTPFAVRLVHAAHIALDSEDALSAFENLVAAIGRTELGCNDEDPAKHAVDSDIC